MIFSGRIGQKMLCFLGWAAFSVRLILAFAVVRLVCGQNSKPSAGGDKPFIPQDQTLAYSVTKKPRNILAEVQGLSAALKKKNLKKGLGRGA